MAPTWAVPGLFYVLMQVLSIFLWMSWIRMLKRFNKAQIRCPVVVYEQINAVLKRKTPKNAKNFPIFNVFKKFLSNFR